MFAHIQPFGAGQARIIETVGDPEWGDERIGGYGDCTFTAVVPTTEYRYLRDARVYLFGPTGPCYAGHVWSVKRSGEGLTTVTCAGWGAVLAGYLRAKTYTTQTAEAIVNDILDQLESSPGTGTGPDIGGPSGSAYREIAALGGSYSLDWAADKTLQEQMDEMCKVLDAEIAWRGRIIAGTPWAVPVYRARPTTPAYYTYADDPGVSIDSSGDSLDGLATTARVYYNGGASYTDRTDATAGHYLVDAGRTRMVRLSTASVAVADANTYGDSYLALVNQATYRGTITLRSAVRDANGAPVAPCDVLAGNILRVQGTGDLYNDLGYVDAVIEGARHIGPYAVTLDCTRPTDGLSDEMQRLERVLMAAEPQAAAAGAKSDQAASLFDAYVSRGIAEGLSESRARMWAQQVIDAEGANRDRMQAAFSTHPTFDSGSHWQPNPQPEDAPATNPHAGVWQGNREEPWWVGAGFREEPWWIGAGVPDPSIASSRRAAARRARRGRTRRRRR